MKGLEIGKDKVKKICDAIRLETIEPAKQEADHLIREAKQEAEMIIQEARAAAERLHEEARKERDKQRAIFEAALSQACKQSLASLKSQIEEKFFHPELYKIIHEKLTEPDVLGRLITAVVEAIEKEGISTDFSVYIPASVPASSINQLLSRNILDRLKEKSLLIGGGAGGIEVKLHDKQMTIDLTDAALIDLVANYIRKDFRSILYAT